MKILKFIFSYEYRNEKEHLEADYPAHCVDSYGYCYHSWSDELHDLKKLRLQNNVSEQQLDEVADGVYRGGKDAGKEAGEEQWM